MWWPAAAAGLVVGVVGWTRARAAIADLTTLTEASLDLHGRAPATALGVAAPETSGPLSPLEGEEITGLVRKGR